MRKSFYTALLLGSCLTGWAQEKTPSESDLMNMSLEQLMNIEIVSASKKAENLFDAPFSASVLTKEEIKKAGATSIMEAFRLMPGLIVREKTNGVYDIHLRGLDNVPPNSTYTVSSNTTTLVMIDNRPVYNYQTGGTFWETLPVDLNDVERIELVRGPASAMYGPNAVSGVINIITRKPEKDGVFAVANAQAGMHQTYIYNASLGYKFNDKLNAVISGNYQKRNRYQTSYYEVYRHTLIDLPDSLRDTSGKLETNTSAKYPHPELAMDKYASNVFVNYTPTEKIKLGVAAGLEDSEVQKAYAENQSTVFSTSTSRTKYADLRMATYGFTGQVSYLDGTQVYALGYSGVKYDFNTLDASIEYNYTFKGLSLKPGLMYRKAVYDDTQYSDPVKKDGLYNARRAITTQAASLRADYKLPGDKLRLIGALRVDKFNYPRDLFLSYQLAANYKINEKHLIRLVHSKADRSSTINDIYMEFIPVKFAVGPPNGPKRITESRILGNKEVDLLTTHMLEAGYRVKLAQNLQADLEVFGTKTKNYALSITEATLKLKEGPDSLFVKPIVIENIPLTARQLGATLSLNYVVNRFQIKPFVTVQQTKLYDYSEFNNTPDAPNAKNNLNDAAANNMYSGIGTTMNHKGTPAIYGGAFIHYQISPKFNVNLSTYYYSAQTYYNRATTIFRDGVRGIDHIPSKVLLNSTLTYTPLKQVSIFVSGKNIINNRSREFYRADGIKANYLGGVSFEF